MEGGIYLSEMNLRTPAKGNMAPTTQAPSTDPPVICLDYLKGRCDSRRWKCRFAHPPRNLIGDKPVVDPLDAATAAAAGFGSIPGGPVSGYSSGSGGGGARAGPMHGGSSGGGLPQPEVCRVWLLTGYCKFGTQCHGTHPPLEEIYRRAGLKNSPAVLHGKFQPPKDPSAVLPPSNLGGGGATSHHELDPVILRSCSCLQNLSTSSEGVNHVAAELISILSDPQHQVRNCHSITKVIFTKAIHEADKPAVYAALLRQIAESVPAIRPLLSSELIELINTLATKRTLGELSNDLVRSRRQTGLMLLGYAYQEDVVSESQIFNVFANILSKPADEAAKIGQPPRDPQLELQEEAFNLECIINLLHLVGKRLDSTSFDGVDELLYQMLTSASRHSPELYMSVVYLIVLREYSLRFTQAAAATAAATAATPPTV